MNIMGESQLAAADLNSYLLSINPSPQIGGMDPLEFCNIYIEEGNAEGVAGDIAFCQSIKETGWFRFGGQVLPEQYNYSGIGALNNEPIGKGAWFKDQREGIRAQIQHLKAYASAQALNNPCVDPRYKYVQKGVASLWTDLNGRWAVPGDGYGEAILALYAQIPRTVRQTPLEFLAERCGLDKGYWQDMIGKVGYLDLLFEKIVNNWGK